MVGGVARIPAKQSPATSIAPSRGRLKPKPLRGGAKGAGLDPAAGRREGACMGFW